MKNKGVKTLQGAFILLLLLAGWCAGQSNSLFLRGYKSSIRSADGKETGRSYINTSGPGQSDTDKMTQQVLEREVKSMPVLKASWITVEEPSPKDFRVHDLITIVVNEVSKNSTKADNKTNREYEMSSQISDWFDFANGGVRASEKKNGEPKLGMKFKSEFEGEGDISREDMLMARIQAEIIDVLPNGNIVLEATHTVSTDEEETKITLTGTCRTKDVGIDNTIISSKLSNLELQKRHKGMARDVNKPGMVTRVLNFLNPF